MSKENGHMPMTDKTQKPTEREMLDFIGGTGRARAWSEIRNFIESQYDIEPETSYGERNMVGRCVTAKAGKHFVP